MLRDDQKNLVTMVQLACETDFVAKTDKFQEGVRGVLNTLHANSDLKIVGEACQDVDYIAKLCQSTNMVQPLDADVASQNIEEGLKYTIAKTQENVQLVRVLQTTWNPDEGEALRTYVHAQTSKGSGIGKIGSLVHLSRSDKKNGDKLADMANQLAMHNAAMKATYVQKEDIPQSVIDELLASEGGEKAVKKYIKRDVLFEQELATAEKSMTVGKFLKGRGK